MEKDKFSKKGRIILAVTLSLAVPQIIYGFATGQKLFVDTGVVTLILGGFFMIMDSQSKEEDERESGR